MKNLSLLPQSLRQGLTLVIEFGKKDLLSFQVDNSILTAENKDVFVKELLRSIAIRTKLDNRRNIDGLNVYSVKKLLPNRTFTLNVLFDGELIRTAMTGFVLPTIVLKDLPLLGTYLADCFSFGIDCPERIVPELTKEPKAIKPAKVMTAQQKAQQKANAKERAEKIALIKADRMAKSADYAKEVLGV